MLRSVSFVCSSVAARYLRVFNFIDFCNVPGISGILGRGSPHSEPLQARVLYTELYSVFDTTQFVWQCRSAFYLAVCFILAHTYKLYYYLVRVMVRPLSKLALGHGFHGMCDRMSNSWEFGQRFPSIRAF